MVYHNPGVLHYASWFASRCQVLDVSSVDRSGFRQERPREGVCLWRSPALRPLSSEPSRRSRGAFQRVLLPVEPVLRSRRLRDRHAGIDYQAVLAAAGRRWPFAEFVKQLASHLGRKGGLTAFTTEELESLQKGLPTSDRVGCPHAPRSVPARRYAEHPRHRLSLATIGPRKGKENLMFLTHFQFTGAGDQIATAEVRLPMPTRNERFSGDQAYRALDFDSVS